jgi:hypothetical protein
MQLKPLSSFEGGHALRATTWVVPAGKDKRLNIQMGVDTLSDATFASRHLLRNVHDIASAGIRTTGSSTSFREEGTLRVVIDDATVDVPALVATASQLPTDCSALLGIPAILALGISLDQQLLEQGAPLICHLGEKKLREWWEAHQGESVAQPFRQ